MGNPLKKAKKALKKTGRAIDKHGIQPVIKPVKKPVKQLTHNLEKCGATVRPTYNSNTGAGVNVNVNYSK